MKHDEKLMLFYQSQLPDGVIEGTTLKSSCPFCEKRGRKEIGKLEVNLDGRGNLNGYFRCLTNCVPPGFAPHFARLKGLDPAIVPGFDPERESYVSTDELPLKNMNQEVGRQQGSLTPEIYQYFAARGVGPETLSEMKIGFNGRYLVFPYFWENDCC
jgi:replicative DNA helicase